MAHIGAGDFNIEEILEENPPLDAGQLQDAEARYQELLENERRGLDNERLDNERRDLMFGVGDVNVSPPVIHYPMAPPVEASPAPSLASEIANVRSRIQTFMKTDGTDSLYGNLFERLQQLEQENLDKAKALAEMGQVVKDLCKKVNMLDIRISLMELEKKEAEKSAAKNVDSVVKNGTVDEDDDVDLFGSDEETEEDRRIKEERLKAYEDKKAKKTKVVAKSSVVLDVKPWSDETDLKEMEIKVRKIESSGLKWGAAKLVPLAYGIKKLQIIAIVEDDNCSIDWLQEQIEAIEDLVQSVDIAAFNKL